MGIKVSKHESNFKLEKDFYYRDYANSIQLSLFTLHQNSNDKFLLMKNDLDLDRDYELLRLKLYRDYRIAQVELEYKQDLLRAKDDEEKMIGLIKDKLHEKLTLQINQLKDDKMLLNLVNAALYNGDSFNNDSFNGLNLAALKKRSLRKREISSRFTTGEADDLSDAGTASAKPEHSGYISASKRRRQYTTRYSSNDEMSSGVNIDKNNINITKSFSANDSNLSDKDYDAISSLIIKNGEVSLFNENKTIGKPNTRGSHRQFAGVNGLKPEELQQDLDLLKASE